MKDQIIIITKHRDSKGGVVNYYNNFFKVFKSENFDLKWFTIGSRPKDYDKRLNRKWNYFLEFIIDIFHFINILLFNKKIKIIQLSPSFFELPLQRDFIFFLISKIFRKKIVVFFRGWSPIFEDKINKNPGLYKYILKTLSKADATIVLAHKFKQTLLDFGFSSKKLFVTRTMFVKSDIQQSRNRNFKNKLIYIYIARISFQKGIIEIIEALNILRKKNLQICIDIYGHFSDNEVKDTAEGLINKYDLQNQITFKGFICGKEKYNALANADVFLMPTYHNEGCPNSIIEALASGLFIISTPVGAINELVINMKNGIIVPAKSPKKLSDSIYWAEKNMNDVRKIAESNKAYAHANYEQDVIVEKIKTIYEKL